jgi:dTDP-4-dehydrorhamnose reductase
MNGFLRYKITMNVLILGHGYVAKPIATEVAKRGWELRDNQMPCDKMTCEHLRHLIADADTDLVINASAYIPPSGRVTHCDDHKAETIEGNVVFPNMVAQACQFWDVPMIHISTGCLFDEAKEYKEADTPTRGWDGYCGTYVGTKLLAEKLVLNYPKSYVLRIRLPFDEVDHPRNFISKTLSFDSVYDNFNCLTHRGDFAKAALDLFEIGAPFGIYNVVNNGGIYSRMLIQKMREAGLPVKDPQFTHADGVTGCKLSIKKLLATGVKMRWVGDALEDALDNWRKA